MQFTFGLHKKHFLRNSQKIQEDYVHYFLVSLHLEVVDAKSI